ncbi:MAG TPA: GlsB/YeaQ/YmgE family stress response membrane protein [Gemmatimonadaceae bacterium]|nr:GlsB/YeaQ/YmgE family stress response membrane protein [Gemmatimonadaceae bacterium]
MDLVTWLVVGLVAGVLASYVLGGIGYGLLGDIVVGMIGALLGGWLFRALNVSLPFSGLASAIFVAFIGAILFLLILRALLPLRGPRRYYWGRRRPIV